MPGPRGAIFGLTAASLLFAGCALHSTATHWHGHVGADGQPVFVQTSTFVGCNFCIFLPFLGATSPAAMIDAATGRIATADGGGLRLVETETNNYWYAVPPLSWLFSPVVCSVSIEYRPSPAALARAGVRTSADAAAAPAH